MITSHWVVKLGPAAQSSTEPCSTSSMRRATLRQKATRNRKVVCGAARRRCRSDPDGGGEGGDGEEGDGEAAAVTAARLAAGPTQQWKMQSASATAAAARGLHTARAGRRLVRRVRPASGADQARGGGQLRALAAQAGREVAARQGAEKQQAGRRTGGGSHRRGRGGGRRPRERRALALGELLERRGGGRGVPAARSPRDDYSAGAAIRSP